MILSSLMVNPFCQKLHLCQTSATNVWFKQFCCCLDSELSSDIVIMQRNEVMLFVLQSITYWWKIVFKRHSVPSLFKPPLCNIVSDESSCSYREQIFFSWPAAESPLVNVEIQHWKAADGSAAVTVSWNWCDWATVIWATSSCTTQTPVRVE